LNLIDEEIFREKNNVYENTKGVLILRVRWNSFI